MSSNIYQTLLIFIHQINCQIEWKYYFILVVDITQELIDESQAMICESTITRITFEFNITYIFIVSPSYFRYNYEINLKTIERERERGRKRETHRQTDRQTDRDKY